MGKRYLEVCVWESIVLKYQWNWPKHFVPNKETPSCHLTPREIVGNMQTVRFREVHSKFSIIHSLLLPLTCQSPLIVFCLYIVINDGDVSNIHVYVYPLSFHLFITPLVNIHQKKSLFNFFIVFCHCSFFSYKMSNGHTTKLMCKSVIYMVLWHWYSSCSGNYCSILDLPIWNAYTFYISLFILNLWRRKVNVINNLDPSERQYYIDACSLKEKLFSFLTKDFVLMISLYVMWFIGVQIN